MFYVCLLQAVVGATIGYCVYSFAMWAILLITSWPQNDRACVLAFFKGLGLGCVALVALITLIWAGIREVPSHTLLESPRARLSYVACLYGGLGLAFFDLRHRLLNKPKTSDK